MNEFDKRGLPVRKSSIDALIEIYEEDHQKRLKKKEQDGERKLMPFKESIENFASKFSTKRERLGAGMVGSRPSHRAIVHEWLNAFVIKHGSLPVGKPEVSIPFLGGSEGVGDVDFDQL